MTFQTGILIRTAIWYVHNLQVMPPAIPTRPSPMPPVSHVHHGQLPITVKYPMGFHDLWG